MCKPAGWTTAFITVISLQLIAAAVLYITGRLLQFAMLLNLLLGLSLMICWIWEKSRIRNFIFEKRETAVVCAEAILVISTLLFLVNKDESSLFKFIQYCFLAVHLFLLTMFTVFIFMFTSNGIPWKNYRHLAK